MKFEEMLTQARKGGKFRRPSMGESYITVAKVSECAIRIILVTSVGSHGSFSFPNEDILADDWENCEPIVRVNMFPGQFKVKCPTCNREYQVGEKWELSVGDIYKCTCGNRLLLQPPVTEQLQSAATPEVGHRLMSDKVKEHNTKTIDQWPLI